MTTNISLAFVGQSNERGKRWLSDTTGAEVGNGQSARLGPPCTDPVLPNGTESPPATGVNGSILPTIVEGLAAHNIHCWAHNTAKGTSSIVDDWCGDSGDGTPFTAAQIIAEASGSDPSSRLSGLKALTDIGVMDKRVVCISLGQRDAANNTSLAEFQAGIASVVDLYTSYGYYVAIGFTVFQPSTETWYDTVGLPAVAAALVAYADNPLVIEGCNATVELGRNIATLDGTHIADHEYDRWAAAWVQRLKVLA